MGRRGSSQRGARGVASGAMQQWEYRVEILAGTPAHMQPQLGLEGWELVAITVQAWDRAAMAPVIVLKRPLAPGAIPFGWQPG